MISRTRALPIFAALLSALLTAVAQAAPKVTPFTLDNGMEVVVIEDRRAPVVTHMVWYRVGGADEPPGKSGIAHFLEHLMFKGTDEIPDAEFSKIVSANGGQDNAFTSQDYTAYFQRIAADRLELVMRMEADRMRDLRIDDRQVATERDVILEERNQRVENEPFGLFAEQLAAALYLNHPYGIPLIGWRHEMEGLTRQDALDFYARFYAPNNAILVVAGDVAPEEVRTLAEKHFGPLAPSETLEERVRPAEPAQRAPRRVTYADPRVRQPYVTRDYIAPSRRVDPDRAAALLMLAEVLGGGINGRLQQALQVEERIALGVGARYSGSARDIGEFSLYIAPRPDVSLEDAEAAVDREVAAFLASDGPTEAELTRIKASLRASLIYAQDSQMSLAQRYGAGLASDMTLEDIEAWPDRLQAVTADDVMSAAREVLDLDSSVTGWLTAPDAEEEETRG